MLNRLNLLIIFFLIAGCASEVNLNSRNQLIDIKEIRSIDTSFHPDKALYNKLEDTLYILDIKSNLIHFFKGSKRINTIGGLGFGEYSFNKISDIALAPDGNLLVLDSFDRSIKKYDVEGKYIAKFDIEELKKPELFDISLDETMYIYDSGLKEIFAHNLQASEEAFSFGKFIISEPSSLIINDGLIQVYDTDSEKTFFYNFWGDLQMELDGKVLSEKGRNFKLNKNSVTDLLSGTNYIFTTSFWYNFHIKFDRMIICGDDKVVLCDLIYEN